MTRTHALHVSGGMRDGPTNVIHDRPHPFDLPLTHNSPKRCARARARPRARACRDGDRGATGLESGCTGRGRSGIGCDVLQSDHSDPHAQIRPGV